MVIVQSVLHEGKKICEKIFFLNCIMFSKIFLLLHHHLNNYTQMKNKNSRLDAIKILISSKEIGSQDELLNELKAEGFELTQATLSRDLKQLKVAKAASMNGNYVYVLPNNTMYKRMTEVKSASEMLQTTGFISIRFSGNLAVIRTRPGYASSIAYDIDNSNIDSILGTIAGDDTILLVIKENAIRTDVVRALQTAIPNIR